MAAIYEIYGRETAEAQACWNDHRLSGECPFSGSPCDGGGNRHQTAIIGTEDPDLVGRYFQPQARIVPAVCTVEQGATPWVVCPRRFLAFRETPASLLQTNRSLQPHERNLLLAAGVPQGVLLGVWAEVKMSLRDEESAFNYAFDFVIAPPLTEFGVAERAAEGTITTPVAELPSILDRPLWPDLSHPYLIEIMTASTSGSDKTRDIGVRQGFRAALMGKQYEFPGINKRQVWGRMASQLFAKSALGEFWNGKTIWVVQDALLEYIMASTKMKNVSAVPDQRDNLVHFVTMGFNSRQYDLQVKDSFSAPAGILYRGGNDIADILLSKRMPHKIDLLAAMARKQPTALIQL